MLAWPTIKVDLVVAAALAAYAVALFTGQDRHRDVWDVAMLGATVGAIACRRVQPETVLAIAVAVRFVQDITERTEAYPTWALSIAMFTVVGGRGVAVGVAAVVATVAGYIGAAVIGGYLELRPAFIGSTIGFFLPAYGAGLAVRQLRLTNAKLAETATLEERARLRDELHDIVGHHLNVAAVVADTAQTAWRVNDSARLKTSLEAVGEACRTALDQMERATMLLTADATITATLEPTPTLDQVPELCESLRRAGLSVDDYLAVTVADAAALGAVASATAHRFVREATTNVLKHSTDRWCRVTARRDGARILIEVTSAPRSRRSAPRLGSGLKGMTRRVELLGGSVEVDSSPGHFVQRATLPLRRAS